MLGQISNFGSNFKFWVNFQILGQISNLGSNYRFWAKLQILGQITNNFDPFQPNPVPFFWDFVEPNLLFRLTRGHQEDEFLGVDKELNIRDIFDIIIIKHLDPRVTFN